MYGFEHRKHRGVRHYLGPLGEVEPDARLDHRFLGALHLDLHGLCSTPSSTYPPPSPSSLNLAAQRIGNPSSVWPSPKSASTS